MADRRKDKSGKVLRKGESQRKDGTYMYRWSIMMVNGSVYMRVH